MKRIEKIELGLYEIARECRTIDRVINSQESLNAIHEAGGHKVDDVLKELPEQHEGGHKVDDVLKELPEQHEDFLKEVHGKVVELLEMVGEYMNGCDMVSAMDIAINKPIYNLVYERKTEEDFEEED